MSLRNLLLERLERLLDSQFDKLLFDLEGIDAGLRAHINVSGSTPSQRSMALIRYLEQDAQHGLERLCEQLGQPFTVPYAAIVELETLLQRAAMSEDTVRRAFDAYLDTLGEQARWMSPDDTGQPLWDGLFAYLLDPSWMSSGGQHHLIHFISRLARDASQPFALQNWVGKTAKNLGVTPPSKTSLPPDPQEEAQPYLLLAVSPEGGYYNLHAWFKSHSDKPGRIYEKKIGFNFDEMPQHLRKILIDPNVTRACLAGKPPVLEFFLPVNLLNLDLDQWQPPGEKSPLSTKYCVVVRAWERFGEQRWLPDWGRYWRQFQHTLAEPANRRHTAWLNCHSGQCRAHFRRGQWVFSLCFVPDAACFEWLLDSGVSILLWPRWELGQAEQAALKRDVARQKIGHLPEWLRQSRLQHWEKTQKTAGPLSLLWDDPQRWPADPPTQLHPDYRG